MKSFHLILHTGNGYFRGLMYRYACNFILLAPTVYPLPSRHVGFTMSVCNQLGNEGLVARLAVPLFHKLTYTP